MFPPVSSSAGCLTGVASGGGLASWRGVKEKMRELMSGIPCTVRVGPLTASRSYLPPSMLLVEAQGAGVYHSLLLWADLIEFRWLFVVSERDLDCLNRAMFYRLG